jgi:hypothetical protein
MAEAAVMAAKASDRAATKASSPQRERDLVNIDASQRFR